MVVVLCTAPPDGAEALARVLVEGGAAACVNLLAGVTSVYRWQGQVEIERETLLVCKTASADRLSDAIRTHHPYDTPEIVVLDVDDEASDPRYVAWVRSLTGPEAP